MRREMEAGGAEALFAALDTRPSVSIRFNPYKISEKPQGEQVPWCRYGFMLDGRPVFTLDPLLHAGAYYVQDSSSMFIEHLMRSAWDDCEKLRVLDMSAAPGGKSTLLSSLVGLEGLVVANEPVRRRVPALCDNVQRWGLGNVVVTSADPTAFSALEGFFDCVVVDAPCSGEGMFRKDPEARTQWSENNVALCAARQKRILADAWKALREGGTLIYSTCTFNRAENEDNVAWIASKFDCEGVEVDVDPEWGIVAGEAGGIRTFRFLPGQVPGEGFFAAAVRKTGRGRFRYAPARRTIFTQPLPAEVAEARRWMEQPEYMSFAKIEKNIFAFYTTRFADVRTVAEALPALYSGVMMGQIYDGGLKPEHPLALFHDLRRDAAAVAELDRDAALDYLRLSELDPALFHPGINLVCCDGFPLGWVKRIGERVNNMLPKELRIKHLTDKAPSAPPEE